MTESQIRKALEAARVTVSILERAVGGMDDAEARGIDTSADGSITVTSNPAEKDGINADAPRTDLLTE